MPTSLETATVDLDRKTVAALGDSFTYTPADGSPTPAVGFVDYGEDIANPAPAGQGVVSQVIVIELPAADFPVRPSDACRVTGLARYPGETYKPVGSVASDTGFWRFSIKKVAA